MISAATPDVATAAARLRALLGDRLHEPGDPGLRRHHDGSGTVRCQRTPAWSPRCQDADEVAEAVRIAAQCHLPLSVRSGGHDWAGRALRDGGVVLDLTGLRAVDVDVDAATVTIGGGATAAGLLAAARPYDLVVPTGTVGAVGMAGLALAGGYGPLCGRFGLALDSLLGAEVVLADGRRVTADPRHDAELYWALRGGGGNVGMVTELRFRAHRLPGVLAGMIMFALAEAPAVLRGYGALVAEAPDELTVMTGFLPGPAGEPVDLRLPVLQRPGPGSRAAVDGSAARAGHPAGRPDRPDAVRGRAADVRRRDGRRQPLPAADPVAARAHRRRGGHPRRRGPAGQPRRSPRWPCTTSTARPPGSVSPTRRSGCAPTT